MQWELLRSYSTAIWAQLREPVRQRGREIDVMVNGNSAQVVEQLRARPLESLALEALTLEEIFVSTLQPQEACA